MVVSILNKKENYKKQARLLNNNDEKRFYFIEYKANEDAFVHCSSIIDNSSVNKSLIKVSELSLI